MSSFSNGTGAPQGSLRLLKKKIRMRKAGGDAALRGAADAGRGAARAAPSSHGDSCQYTSEPQLSGRGQVRAIAQSSAGAVGAVGAVGAAGSASGFEAGGVPGIGGGKRADESKGEPELKFYTKPALKWTNPSGQSCIPIRGESRCLCGCRKKVHKWDSKRRSFRCTKPGCKCKSFFFIVAEGAWKLRCSCKHAATDHDPSPGKHKCTRRGCKCNGFVSPWVCNCGAPWTAHTQSVHMVKFVSVNGTEMPASMFAQMTGIDTNGEGIAPEINRVSRDPKFGLERY